MKTGAFIVGSINNGVSGVSVARRPVQHSTLDIARTEAERLAKIASNEPEAEFVVLEIKGRVKRVTAPVAWS